MGCVAPNSLVFSGTKRDYRGIIMFIDNCNFDNCDGRPLPNVPPEHIRKKLLELFKLDRNSRAMYNPKTDKWIIKAIPRKEYIGPLPMDLRP